jgi:hypothetical protein
MKLSIFALLLALTGTPAFAYRDGTYRCKNLRNLPDNIYQIRTISVSGVELPHVEATRYFPKNPGEPNGPVSESRLKGIAALVTGADVRETLLLGALQLEFDRDGIAGCARTD